MKDKEGLDRLKELPQDIYNLFDPEVDHICNEKNLEEFAQNVKQVMSSRLRKYNPPESPLRFSALGKPDRQLWYEAHPSDQDKGEPEREPIPLKAYLKFLYGDLIEQMLLFLTKEAGHTVSHEQAEVETRGVKGHIDAIVDGVVVDVKSASPFGYRKFETNSVTEDDPFGYVAQISGYASILTPDKPAAWLAIDKVSGEICVSPLSPIVIKHHLPEERIEHLEKVIESDTPPERCFEDVPDGKSGNRKLTAGCGYCAHKFRCWPNLRAFAYSNGPRFLTKVERVPDVPEFTP